MVPLAIASVLAVVLLSALGDSLRARRLTLAESAELLGRRRSR